MNAFIHYAPGVSVMHDGEHYVITHLLNLESVLAKSQLSGQIKEISIHEISPFSEKDKEKATSEIELSLIETEAWNEAEDWAEKLQPLLDTKQVTVAMISKIATAVGVHISTVYRKFNALRNIGKVSALVKEKKDGGKGKSRLSPEVELVIQNTIATFYFNKEKQKRSKRITYNKIKEDLEAANLEIPAERTIYYRINAILNGGKTKKSISSSNEGLIPDRITGANYPLALVQIDHTKLDIIVVDEIYRQSIGRPWITIVIDVFSRMILGFYLSLDPPGNISVGLCLTHAILPKEKWLAKLNITTPYPCWGIMDIVHADNAGEFHGEMLRRACKEYGIDIEWRPVKKPHYGAHIERLLGIVLNKIHELPGTTFSNKEERGEYDSEKYAQMTLSELEEWLALYITGDYHQQFHESLNTTPIKQYERGILGTKDIPGRGLPRKIENEDRLRLDLMPGIERTVRDWGIIIDYIRYYSGVLSRWKNGKDPDNPKNKRKFIFKRDPRNISVIYFYDPELKEYFRVPYRDTSFPPISIWEYKKIRAYLRQLGKQDVDERLIFETHKKMQEVNERSAHNTKSARRAVQRRAEHKKVIPPQTGDDLPVSTKQKSKDKISKKYIEVLPFDEIEIFDEN